MMRVTIIYAGRLERLLAYLIDVFILLVSTILIAATFNGSATAVIITFFCCLVTYYTYFTSSTWQATPGKRLMNIYVARTDHKSLNQSDALERFLALILPILPLFTSFIPENVTPLLVFWLTIFWFAPILFTNERIGYHDRLCKTRVLVGKVGR